MSAKTRRSKSAFVRAALLSVLGTAVLATASAQTISLGACGVLNQTGATYVLQNDVNSDGTCFPIQADNITLDLNGHTATYDDASIPPVANGDFEQGSGAAADFWDFSQAPQAARIQGSYIQPVQVWGGGHSIAFSLPASAQFIKSAQPLALSPGRTYVVSAMVYNQVDDNAGFFLELDDASNGLLLSSAALTGKNARGFKYFHILYRPSAPVGATVKVGIRGAGLGAAGALYVDDVRLQTGRNYGVAGLPCWDVANQVATFGTPCGGSWKGLKVKNGIITQGTGSGWKSHAFMGLRGAEIFNTTSTVHGPACQNLHSDYNTGFNIHGNAFYNDSTVVPNRDAFDGAVIFLAVGRVAGTNSIRNNVLRGGAQNGIVLTGQLTPGSEISGNDISQDSRHTNDFSIQLYKSTGVAVFNNYIHPLSGRGIYFNGAGNYVHDNRIQVRELKRNQEYNGCETSGAYGIQIEGGATNNHVYRNQVTAYAEACDASALRLTGTKPTDSSYVFNNSFSAVRVGAGAGKASGVSFGEAANGGVFISSNVFTADTSNLWDRWDGHSNLLFSSNTFLRGENPAPDYATFAWWTAGISTGVAILDATFADGASSTSLSMLPVGFGGWAGEEELLIQWTLSLTVTDALGQPLGQAAVSIRDSAGMTIFSGQTDVQGNIRTALTQTRVYNTAAAATNYQHFTPHAVTVSKSGYAGAATTVAIDSKKSLTVQLQASGPDATPPARPRRLKTR